MLTIHDCTRLAVILAHRNRVTPKNADIVLEAL